MGWFQREQEAEPRHDLDSNHQLGDSSGTVSAATATTTTRQAGAETGRGDTQLDSNHTPTHPNNQGHYEQQECDLRPELQQQQQPRPRPPKTSNQLNGSQTHTPSSALPAPPPRHGFSVSSQAPSTDSRESSVYRDFTGPGHAERGHWNDPPKNIFAAAGKSGTEEGAKTRRRTTWYAAPSSATNAAAQGEPASSGQLSENQQAKRGEDGAEVGSNAESFDREKAVEFINKTIDRIISEAPTDSAMIKRMTEDTSKRMDVLRDCLDSLNVVMVSMINEIALENADYERALTIHRSLSKAAFGDQSKWVIGLKRLIEIAKSTPRPT
ncbi:hypothetical protein EV182_001711 [Spiromyces aspiralis]|uniref:Uncharacterized protein n=1 Tax=Spiromyces aspiralis TaxID=68401 RepID=A0ACC1HHK2_9FUNG|nr:hypothetical protein EV182_001711 [Spiromyces aspiralis]